MDDYNRQEGASDQPIGFKVRRVACSTCIYGKDSYLDINELEDQCKDERGDFQCHRICHHTKDSCCRGFWNRHKNEFTAGQLAQRLDLVVYTDEDLFEKSNV